MLLLDRAGALDMIAEARRQFVLVLGAEGFRLKGEELYPSLEHILDLSVTPPDPWSVAEQFVRAEVPDDMYIELVLGDSYYIGPAEFQDGHVERLVHGRGTATVTIRGASGGHYEVRLTGIVDLQARHPEGMMLYGLTRLPAGHGLYRYAFLNWDENDDAHLEALAATANIASVAR